MSLFQGIRIKGFHCMYTEASSFQGVGKEFYCSDLKDFLLHQNTCVCVLVRTGLPWNDFWLMSLHAELTSECIAIAISSL